MTATAMQHPAEAPLADVQILDLNCIHTRPGHNPRNLRSQDEVSDIRESIRKVGVLTPILVRPHPEKTGEYELVAGETRYLLSIEVGHETIPVLIRDIKDSEMVEHAMVENLYRQAMSPCDEGRAAQKLIAEGYTNEEVCTTLGWKPNMLRSRIQLTYCVQEVGQALMDKTISIGHAQLLSGLRDSVQPKALMLILKKGLSVDDFRAELDQLSLRLSTASFDTSECAACPHNSSTQASLFDAQTSSGRCLNKPCFEQKHKDFLEQTRDDLAESNNRVAFSEEVAKDTTRIIVSTGKTGVGQQQISACNTCADSGAIIDTALGNRAKVTQGVCFNPACHSEKVAAYQHAIGADTETTDQTPNDAGDSIDAITTTSAAPQAKAATGKPASPQKGEPAKPKRSAIPSKIVEQHHRVHRTAAANHLSTEKDRRAARIVAILALLNDCHQKPEGLPEGMPKTYSGVDRAKAAVRLDTLDDAALDDLMLALTSEALNKASRGDGSNGSETYGALAEWYSATRSADLTKHFQMNAEYLSAFTKPVIGELLTESGFAKAYNGQKDDEKAFDALIKGKKTDILEAVKASKFDFQGFIPKPLKI